jgi:CRISPR-associated protein (TIGR02710 family)
MPQQETIKALLISVGEDPQRVVFTINRYRPEYLLFFVTEQTRNLIESVIQPGIQQMPKRWDSVVTPNPANFSDCYRALEKQLSGLLHNWQIQPGELVVDYTGGTPSMVMALALAATDHCTRLVFSAEPGPVFQEANPWDQRAVDESRKAAVCFNQGRYAQARVIFSRLQERVSGGLKPLYRAFSDLADGYDLWESFQHQKALEKLKVAKRALELSAVWGGPTGLKTVLTTVDENLRFLEKIIMTQRKPDQPLFIDLMASAKRQVEMHHHYENAMVRLYRALEVLAQVQLDKAFKIKSHDVRPEQLPEGVREEYRRSFTSELDGRIKLPLYAAYNLLKLLGDSLGQNFFNLWPQIKLVLDVRHQSILAHGFENTKPERYQQLWDLVLKLSGVRPESLPRFPQMEF